MIDRRFSVEAFAALGPNTPEAERLCEELADEIARDVGEAMGAAVRRVAERLRSLGHPLDTWEHAGRPGQHTHDYSALGPNRPRPPAGWLAFHVSTYCMALFLRADAEADAPGPAAQDDPRHDDEVPF